MANDNPFLNDNPAKPAITIPSAPVKPDEPRPYGGNADDASNAVEESNEGMPIGAVRGIGRKSNLEDLKGRSVNDDTLMNLLSEDDSDDTSLDYDGDGEDNDLDGEPDGE